MTHKLSTFDISTDTFLKPQVIGDRALSVPSSITEEVDILNANDSGLERFFGCTTASEVTAEVTEADLDDVVFTDRMLRFDRN